MTESARKVRRKVVFILIDGLGDVPLSQLGRKTPLEAANTPAMDQLAAMGINGLLDPVEPGLACGSDTAHLSILGYDPRKYYRGRGAFETMGAGLPMEVGDIAFKCNFATMDPSTKLVVRADRKFEAEGPVLSDFLNGIQLPSFPNHTVAVKYATEHRCGVRVRGPGLSDNITGTDPLKDNLPLIHCERTDSTQEAEMTARLTNEMSKVFHEKLSEHPVNALRKSEGKNEANCVLLRGCGALIDVPSFEARNGFTAFMIAPTAIIAGLGMSLDIDVVKVPGATGDYETNLDAKVMAAADVLRRRKQYASGKEYDFGFVHIKAVDDAGHDKDVSRKIEFLEKTDKAVSLLLHELADADDEYLVVITGDHSTPVLRGDHSSEPVPILCSSLGNSSTFESDSVANFSEHAAAQGALGRFCGSEVMTLMRDLASS